MLVLGAVLGLVAIWSAVPPTSRDIAAALLDALALPAIWRTDPFYVNSPTWSLFFEIVANIYFAFAARQLTLRRQLGLCLVLMMAMLWLDGRYGLFGFGWMRSAIPAGLVRVGASFILGTLLARAFAALRLRMVHRRWWPAPMLIITFVMLPTFSTHSIVYDPLVVFLVYPVILLGTASCEPLSHKVAKISGDLSYPFYIIHMPVLSLLERFLAATGSPAGPWMMAACLAATVLLSALLLRVYDEPIRTVLRRRFGTKRHASVPV